jgi:hypothetical protein
MMIIAKAVYTGDILFSHQFSARARFSLLKVGNQKERQAYDSVEHVGSFVQELCCQAFTDISHVSYWAKKQVESCFDSNFSCPLESCFPSSLTDIQQIANDNKTSNGNKLTLLVITYSIVFVCLPLLIVFVTPQTALSLSVHGAVRRLKSWQRRRPQSALNITSRSLWYLRQVETLKRHDNVSWQLAQVAGYPEE